MKKHLLIAFVICALFALFCGLAYAQRATEQDALRIVEKAGKLIEKKGDEALPAICDPNGEFFNREKALYAFVYNENIVVVAHPYLPELIGQCLKGKTDVNGRKFRDEIVRKALEEGSGWTEYTYQMPCSTEGDMAQSSQVMRLKKTYGKLFRHGHKKYIVCAGTYD